MPEAEGSLTDWDALAVDERGNPTNGVSETSVCGVRVEIHRNWIHFMDQAAWRPGAHTPPGISMSLVDGEVTYLDTFVVARRGPQDGIYFVSWFMSGEGVVGMAGIGCRGYNGDTYTGVGPSSVDFLRKTIADWSEAGRIPVSFRSAVLADKVLRFNQGELFVAIGAGYPVEATRPGEASLPLPVQFVRNAAAAAAKAAEKENSNHVPT